MRFMPVFNSVLLTLYQIGKFLELNVNKNPGK